MVMPLFYFRVSSKTRRFVSQCMIHQSARRFQRCVIEVASQTWNLDALMHVDFYQLAKATRVVRRLVNQHLILHPFLEFKPRNAYIKERRE
jgi:hypothetical protein